MSDLIEREYLLNIARQEEAYGYVSEHEILNAPNAETTGALDDAIQEYIKDGYILAEPKVDAWIDDEEYNTEYGYYFAHCSECGYQMDVHENRGYHNFCPNCGAKMEGSK